MTLRPAALHSCPYGLILSFSLSRPASSMVGFWQLLLQLTIKMHDCRSGHLATDTEPSSFFNQPQAHSTPMHTQKTTQSQSHIYPQNQRQGQTYPQNQSETQVYPQNQSETQVYPQNQGQIYLPKQVQSHTQNHAHPQIQSQVQKNNEIWIMMSKDSISIVLGTYHVCQKAVFPKTQYNFSLCKWYW